MPRHRRHLRAFTLLELVLVMAIIATALAIVAPSLGGWGRGAEARGVAEQFVSMARRARAMAVSDAAVYRVGIESDGASFRLTVQEAGGFVPVTSTWGQPVAVPPGARMDIEGGNADGTIHFYPTGRCDVARVRFTDARGGTYEVASASPAEAYELIDPTAAGAGVR